MFDTILGSSTPDGIAPLSFTGLIIFTFSFSGIAILWGILNFLKLFSIGPDNQQQGLVMRTQEVQQIREMGGKIIHGSLNFMKFNFIVIISATILFFIAIMGALQQFNQFDLSVSYILGSVGAILCSFFTIITSSMSYFRIVYSSKFSSDGAFAATKFASNAITFITTGFTFASLMGIMIYSDPVDKRSKQQINHRGNMLICFAFGYTTVCILSKITSLIYCKGVQNSFQISHMFRHNLPKDQNHPQVICKAIGQTVNKTLSKTLDFSMFITLIISITTKCAGMNIVGTDQKGQIVFQLYSDNAFSAFTVFGFGFFFIILISLFRGSPQNAQQIKTHFRIHLAGITIFLSGFTALACYLALPAQFQIAQFMNQKIYEYKSPVYAYLSVLIGMFLSILITFSTEIVSSHPYFIYSLLNSCKTGGATCLISGLSMGYLYNFLPVIALASFGFLCHFWLGKFGVAMGLMGIAIYIPYHMYINLYHSLMNTSSMITFVNKISDQSINNLLKLNQSKKYFEQQNYIYLNQITALLGYVIISTYCANTDQTFQISNPKVFSGLLVGAMLPYSFSGQLIKALYQVAPVICYDIQQQAQQNSQITKGKSQQIDFYRSNGLYLLNVTLQIFRFLPILLFPNIFPGLLFGVLTQTGFTFGLVASAIQLSMSNSLSGSLWNNTKDQISYSKAKNQDNQDITIDSEWGKASQIGSLVGSNIRDCSGQSLYILVFWTLTVALVFQDLYIRIHSA